MPDYLSAKQVAEKLGISYETVARLIRRGVLPAVKVGGQWRVKASDLDAWLKQPHAERAQ